MVPNTNNLSTNNCILTLAELLNQNKLIVFVGSGISIDSGLPTWDGLMQQFIEFCRSIQKLVALDPSDKFDDLLKEAETDKSKYPIRVASVLKQKLQEIDNKYNANIKELLQNWLLDLFYYAQVNDNHRYIVKTNFPFILTTNYDRLLEKAAQESNFLSLYSNSYTFLNADKVASAIHNKNPAIIHIHGDPKNIYLDDFVFTAEDYIRIRRKYPGFTLSIQTLFMTYSILFIGYGGSDPHLEELLEELSYYFNWSNSQLLPQHFLLMKKGKANSILSKYKEKLRTKIIEIDDYSMTSDFLSKLQQAAPRPT